MNSCLREGVVPARYKRARLVLIPKKGKAGKEAGDYRPVCLLDGEGKVLERLLGVRAERVIAEAGGLSPKQFGFRRGRSTVDALLEVRRLVEEANTGPLRGRRHCLAIALDARNAFNSMPWKIIMEALRKWGMPEYLLRMFRSYLEGRTLEYTGENGVAKTAHLSGGIPQGSVLGPMLWNAAYDEVFRLPLPEGVELVGFADDLLIVARRRGIADVKEAARAAAAKVSDWLESVGIQVAAHKTVAAWMSRRRAGRIKGEAIEVLGHEVVIEGKMKYLGVMIEPNPLHSTQVSVAARGAAKAAGAIARLMANVGGPKEATRRVLMGAALSRLLYAAPAWAGCIGSRRNCERLRRAMRPGALRVVRGYRTLSTDAAEVLASMPPADLLVAARAETHRATRGGVPKRRAKEEAELQLMLRWQERWSRGVVGAWTRALIPDVESWTKRRQGEMDYGLTQMLSGHGCFMDYLCRIGKAQDASCHWCPDGTDSAKHTLLECEGWSEERCELEGVLGATLDVTTLVQGMLEEERIWAAVSKFSESVLKKKEELLASEVRRAAVGDPQGVAIGD